ncbi:lipopolysaccharide export system permease protein [Aliiruegeria haliotis]|uniref:Lipopolysaccharide export system permease protein n=1 Tax=Aliiruegeria haliotis TaxID=1280846 RepID=A0A2T0S0D2_9RHOB|nr:LPS export ABC transporter permease LptG [Aliiruegeria haliotis]PRY26860.1 lipopolysaccharide export system permease protein [Aliiruegeria haliotis]
MKLQFYFARKFLMTLLGIFVVFAAFITLLDMVEQMRRFDSSELSFAGALELALLSSPETLYSILPLVVMLATLALFLNLARTSELVVTRATGRSAIRAMISPALAAALVGVLGVTVMNPLVSATKHVYEKRAAEYSGNGRSVLSVSGEGLWLRQGGPEGQTVIRAVRTNIDGTVLYDVTFTGFAPEGSGVSGPVRRAQAGSATLIDGAWKLNDVKLWPLGVANPEQEASYHHELLLPSTLTQEQILDSFGSPAAVSIWDLPAFIRNLDEAGFSARLHRVWFQMELALPLFLASMVMIGAGFTMRHTRFGRTGLMVLFSLLMGFSAFFIRSFAQILGQNGDIPVSLAAWAPPVIAILMSLGILLHLEDG